MGSRRRAPLPALMLAGALIAGCSAARAQQTGPATSATGGVSASSPTTDGPSDDEPATTHRRPTASSSLPSTTERRADPTTTAAAAPTTSLDDHPTTTEQPATTTEQPTATTTAPPAPTTSDADEPDPTAPPQTVPPASAPPTSIGVVDLALPHLRNAVQLLAPGNLASSVTVWRDHEPIFELASGTQVDGAPMTSDSPMVLASVSKLITALTVARLVEDGEVDADAPVAWGLLGFPVDGWWGDVTWRELLDHTSGMPKAQNSWLNLPGSCAIPLAEAMASPPRESRGRWLYSNGNYCALGLLIEAITGADRASAADLLVFAPADITGPHLSTDGAQPGDAPYVQGVARLERLGGAGTWIASTDDITAMLDSVTPEDMATLRYPGVMIDQYGWGHTGTVDGAKACAWVMEGGRTVVTAIVSGQHPATGGKVCDIVLPALAADLGVWAAEPVRLPT